MLALTREVDLESLDHNEVLGHAANNAREERRAPGPGPVNTNAIHFQTADTVLFRLQLYL